MLYLFLRQRGFESFLSFKSTIGFGISINSRLCLSDTTGHCSLFPGLKVRHLKKKKSSESGGEKNLKIEKNLSFAKYKQEIFNFSVFAN